MLIQYCYLCGNCMILFNLINTCFHEFLMCLPDQHMHVVSTCLLNQFGWLSPGFNISNKSNLRRVLGLINMGNREYMPCPRSHVVVGFHSSYAFLKNNLVYAILNLLRKKRVRVYAMPNSLLRETNSLRSICHALRLAAIKCSSCNLSIGKLFYCISMISGRNQSPAPYLY
jgi:hypothetical protein